MSPMKQMPRWDWTCKIFMEKMLIKTQSVCREGVAGASLVVQWLESTLQCREHWFHPRAGKILHAAGVTEPMGHNK